MILSYSRNPRRSLCLVMFFFHFFVHSSVGAQPANSVSYQGVLHTSQGNATGTYDLQFALTESITNTNSLFEPLVLTNVAVSNGLFSVSLDFTNYSFQGSAQWLRIAVRSNALDTWTYLSPSQPITATPLALYALNCTSPTNLSTALSATNPANLFNGTYYGDAAGLTNIDGNYLLSGSVGPSQLASNVISQSNLTLDYAVMLACASSDCQGHVGRFGWTNTLNALRRTKGPIKIECVGNGWTGDSIFEGFLTNAWATFGMAGFGELGGPYNFCPVGEENGPAGIINDYVWHGTQYRLTNNQVQVWSVAGTLSCMPGFSSFAPNIVNVYYLAAPTNGSFKVQYSTNGSGVAWTASIWQDLPNNVCNSSNANVSGKVFSLTNKLASACKVRITASGSNTVILSVEQLDSSSSGIFASTRYSHQGTSSDTFILANTNVVYPIWRTIAPDLILAVADNNSFGQQCDYLRGAGLQADIVNCWCQVTSTSYDTSSSKSLSRVRAMPFFDGQAATCAAYASYANGVALGLYSDSAHMTDLGYSVYGRLLWSWMGLSAYSLDAKTSLLQPF